MHLKSKKKVSIMLSQGFFRPEVSTTLLCKLWENIPFHWENTSINYSWFEKFSIKVWPLSLCCSLSLPVFLSLHLPADLGWSFPCHRRRRSWRFLVVFPYHRTRCPAASAMEKCFNVLSNIIFNLCLLFLVSKNVPVNFFWFDEKSSWNEKAFYFTV